MIRITIPGTPVAKGRPRAMRMGKTGIRMYTPAKTSDYEAACRSAALLAMAGKAPLQGALRVGFVLYMPVPSSLSAKKRAQLLGTPHIKKPDTSNIIKAVEDALNGVAWHDDAQIAYMDATKLYSDDPRVEVCIEEV